MSEIRSIIRPSPRMKTKINLFPMPRNRTRPPTDAEVLLHALAIAIRDKSSHAKLRGLIAHLPRIMNRANPYNKTEEDILKLQDRNAQLEIEIRACSTQCTKLIRKLETRPMCRCQEDAAIINEMSEPPKDKKTA